jgi:hypothetical protein
MSVRVSLTQRGQSESVERGQPSGGNVRSRRLMSGAGAQDGCTDGRSKRALYRAMSGQLARAAAVMTRASHRCESIASLLFR